MSCSSEADIRISADVQPTNLVWTMMMPNKLIYSIAVLIVLLSGGCSTLPPGADFPKTASTALAHPENTLLGQNFDQARHANEGSSGFRIIQAGADGFLMRMQMIQAAQRALDLQYYIFHGDETGRLLTGALISAADRGVRIRVLVDDGETDNGDEQIALLEAHPSIEIRIFNPFAYRGHSQFLRATEFLFNAQRLDYRMHNKLLVIDNSIALIGGRNIGDQYFQIDPDSQFADDDMFATGPITQQLSGTFDEFWNNGLAIPSKALSGDQPTRSALNDHRTELKAEIRQMKTDGVDFVKRIAAGEPFNGIVSGRLPLIWAHAQLVSDSPDKKKVESGEMVGRLMHREVAKATLAVQTEILMVSPYLIPGKEGMQIFSDLRQRNVRVCILTNSLESSTMLLAQAGYMHYRKPLLEDGVELYEIRSLLGNTQGSGETSKISRFGNYSLHGKLFVFDRKRLFIGSMNFDQRSMHLNTEIGLLIDSPELAQQVAARFDAMTQPENSYRLTLIRNDVDRESLVWNTQEHKKNVSFDIEPARSSWQRTKADFLSWLPLDSEL
jgi:putative cardiolipin synthase